MASKRTALIDDDFAFMEQDDDNTAAAPEEDIYHVSDTKLKNHDIYPEQMPLRLQNRKNPASIRIRYRKTTGHKGREFFVMYERWYVKHQMLGQTGTGSDIPEWERMLLEDPVGNDKVPKNNGRCWKAQTVNKKTKYVKTEFLRSLELFQNINYLYYRASLHRYLCDDSQGRLSTWITHQEQMMDPPLDKSNRLDPDIRIPWSRIKEFCLSLCAPTLGSYYFLTLFKMKRKKDEGFHAWVHNISKVNAKIRRYGTGYERVCERESMHVMKHSLAKKERETLIEHLAKKNMHTTYADVHDIVEKMDVDTFQDFIKDIPMDKLPSVIPAGALKDGVRKTLVPYEVVSKLEEKIAAQSNQIKQLQEQVGKIKNAEQHQRRKAQVLDTEKGERKHDDKHNAGVPVGKFGKAKPGHCQLCKRSALTTTKED